MKKKRKTIANDPETAATTGYLLGISVGWDEAAKMFQKLSGDEFAAGRDKEAHIFRQVAAVCDEQQKDRRRRYDNFKSHRSTLDKSELNEGE